MLKKKTKKILLVSNKSNRREVDTTIYIKEYVDRNEIFIFNRQIITDEIEVKITPINIVPIIFPGKSDK